MGLEELIESCKQGNRKAQERLYRELSPALFGTCLKYSRNRTEAEDHLHDSFLCIFDKIGQFKATGSFEGWAKRIAVNTIMQKYREEGRLKIVSDNFKDEGTNGYESTGEIEVESRFSQLRLETLLGYIQELPHKYRLTFTLYVLDGYSHKEIAALLGTSPGTSKSNLARARLCLKEKIETERNIPIIGVLLFILMESCL
ncbi:RNA polymerase sigma factor [Pricia sp. S334]|uniref:RNA polymerase sigma factor n=1 Tax=Pricia mediterranea TaxID=3076079 RepID=A0ABU3L5E9_9FLAO|nr:RNA polymerase sigma factor [Pricia sp. S334]MDT7828949.1 RNA polymerase sigma factor [Pricia sp. S334]